jgi:hypothetical protein
LSGGEEEGEDEEEEEEDVEEKGSSRLAKTGEAVGSLEGGGAFFRGEVGMGSFGFFHSARGSWRRCSRKTASDKSRFLEYQFDLPASIIVARAIPFIPNTFVVALGLYRE